MSRLRRLWPLFVLSALTACTQRPQAPAPTGPPQGAAKAAPAAKAGGAKIKLAFLVKQPEEKWFQDEWKFAKKCAADNGFEIITLGDKDGPKILQMIDTIAAQGAQGFVICTPDTKLGPAIVAKAKTNNLKVYAVDDQFIGADGQPMEDVPYMGISAADIGQMVGQKLYEEFKKQGWKLEETAAAGITFTELATAKARTDGAVKALTAAGFAQDRIFTMNEKTTDVPGAQVAMDSLLTRNAKIKHWLVFSMNDEGVLGAVRSLEAHQFAADSCLGIGIGGSSCFAELERAQPTSFAGTVLISPKRHGYETTEALYKWVKDGVKPPQKTLTKGIYVDRASFKETARREGLMD